MLSSSCVLANWPGTRTTILFVTVDSKLDAAMKSEWVKITLILPWLFEWTNQIAQK